MTTKLPPGVLAYFREQGARGGRIGGGRALETMTREQRVARAKKASAAAVVARKAEGEEDEGQVSGENHPRPDATDPTGFVIDD